MQIYFMDLCFYDYRFIYLKYFLQYILGGLVHKELRGNY